jgi:hypothetical protein
MTNNEGVQLLTSGNIAGALRAFQSAMAIMKEAASSPPSETLQTNLTTDRTDPFFALNNNNVFSPEFRTSTATVRLRHTSMNSN